MLTITRAAFERVVADALDELPERFLPMLENVAIEIRDEPSPEDLAGVGLDPAEGEDLFGLYVGVPLTEREVTSYLGLPDRVFIFRGPILRYCRSVREARQEIRDTVIHELGHHLGMEEEDLPY